jgi:predicted small lipoprotein YifL
MLARGKPTIGAAAAGVVLAVLIGVVLAGCGKKAQPVPPPGEKVTYPQVYPHD